MSRSRRTSRQQYDDEDDTASLLLSRTRSQDVNIGESIAVQDAPVLLPDSDKQEDATANPWPHSTRYLVLLCAFLTSLSFGVTQVPLLYVFRLMTCDAYYKDHASQTSSALGSSILSYATTIIEYSAGTQITANSADRCAIRSVESSTALAVTLLGASTCVFGLLNLFFTGALIKRIGLKPTLIIQVFFPAVRLLVQNIGVEVWGSTGITIVQCSQIMTIVGGPSGYVLALNSFITEVVEYEGRTAALGMLNGCMMFGSALGFLIGGVVADAFNIKAPFRLTLILFLFSAIYVAIFLPRIAPAEPKDPASSVGESSSSEKKGRSLIDYFGPLAVFRPRKFIGKDGVVRREYGTFLLACGVFLAILATGNLANLLQLFATNIFGFGTQQNGWLIFMYSMLRGLFLTFAFPKIIAVGRKMTTRRENDARDARVAAGEQEPLLGAQRTNEAGVDEPDVDKVQKKEQRFTFDLTYTRLSLLADGLLTLLCTFVHQGWQMYLVAAVLPFSAGTGSASKGVILQMVGSSASSGERTDALVGISLVENMARISTSFVFGVIFAAFASIGKTELVFACNAAVALIGFGVLLFVRFPLGGSHPLNKDDDSTIEQDT